MFLVTEGYGGGGVITQGYAAGAVVAAPAAVPPPAHGALGGFRDRSETVPNFETWLYHRRVRRRQQEDVLAALLLLTDD